MTTIALEREWHVSEQPTEQPPTGDPDEPLFDVHFMIDPGDGLCSTVVYGVPKDIAHLIASAPLMREALYTCRRELRNYDRTDMGSPNTSALVAIEEADAALKAAEGAT